MLFPNFLCDKGKLAQNLIPGYQWSFVVFIIAISYYLHSKLSHFIPHHPPQCFLLSLCVHGEESHISVFRPIYSWAPLWNSMPKSHHSLGWQCYFWRWVWSAIPPGFLSLCLPTIALLLIHSSSVATLDDFAMSHAYLGIGTNSKSHTSCYLTCITLHVTEISLQKQHCTFLLLHIISKRSGSVRIWFTQERLRET